MPDASFPTIRPARASDLPAILVMRNALNVHERAGCPHASIQPLDLEEFTAIWGATIDDASHCWRIVEAAGVPVGFGLLYLIPKFKPPVGFVQWTYLDRNHRREGVGQKLLDELLGWARSKGAVRVELQYIDNNTSAERFWAKLGFQPYARKCVRYL